MNTASPVSVEVDAVAAHILLVVLPGGKAVKGITTFTDR